MDSKPSFWIELKNGVSNFISRMYKYNLSRYMSRQTVFLQQISNSARPLSKRLINSSSSNAGVEKCLPKKLDFFLEISEVMKEGF